MDSSTVTLHVGLLGRCSKLETLVGESSPGEMFSMHGVKIVRRYDNNTFNRAPCVAASPVTSQSTAECQAEEQGRASGGCKGFSCLVAFRDHNHVLHMQKLEGNTS